MKAATRFTVAELSSLPATAREQAARLLLESFDDTQRYGEERIRRALEATAPPLYRVALVALTGHEVVGVGALKAADWASATHILYLSAVAPGFRGRGVARELLRARLEWLQDRFAHGRVLVSTGKQRRFLDSGFRVVSSSDPEGPKLLIKEW